MKNIEISKSKQEKVIYHKISNEIINFLKDEFQKRNKTKAIVGISGGVDSATVAVLCQKAKLDLYAIMLPYKKRSIKEADEVIKFLNLPNNRIIKIDITPLVDFQIKTLQKVMKFDKITIGNIFSRQRMIIQYAFASCLNGLVVGTQNLSEYCLGYFTQYGDQVADIFPLAGLWKTQVYQLAKYLKIPQQIINRAPTGDLYPGLTDEKDLDFKYKNADQILYLYLIRNYSKEKISNEYGFGPKLVEKVLNRFRITQYKREKPVKCYFDKSKPRY